MLSRWEPICSTGRPLHRFEIKDDDGIYATTFDEVIRDLNKVNNDIYYRIQLKKSRQSAD